MLHMAHASLTIPRVVISKFPHSPSFGSEDCVNTVWSIFNFHSPWVRKVHRHLGLESSFPTPRQVRDDIVMVPLLERGS